MNINTHGQVVGELYKILALNSTEPCRKHNTPQSIAYSKYLVDHVGKTTKHRAFVVEQQQIKREHFEVFRYFLRVIWLLYCSYS